MNVIEIRNAVEVIEKEKDDNELAHELEDDLYVAFIRDVAEGQVNEGDVTAFASEVIKARDIDFDRWYA